MPVNFNDARNNLPGRIYPVAMALGVFLAITFTLCVVFDLWFPGLAMRSAWAPLLPGFGLTWPGFLLGLVETFAYGWFVAVVYVPLFNFFAARTPRQLRK